MGINKRKQEGKREGNTLSTKKGTQEKKKENALSTEKVRKNDNDQEKREGNGKRKLELNI